LESELGLSPARQRGIQEASTDLIIFVDDDNVLDETYLAEAIKIKQEWPSLGVWGSGFIRGDFEVEPPKNLLSWLPVREVTTARWSNLAGSHSGLFGESPEDAIPWGAGLCIRKEIAMVYSQFCGQSSLQITDRQGASLSSGGDTEISFVCCSRGLGTGIFPQLKLTHLIPQHRISEDYIVRFAEGICLSNFLLHYKWQHIIPQSPFSMKTLLSVLKAILLYRGVNRDIRLAWVRALVKAKRIIDMDLRKCCSKACEMEARVPSALPVGADSEISSQSVHPS
jgi:glycosyltransferase involved in cell wall biosynthesis